MKKINEISYGLFLYKIIDGKKYYLLVYENNGKYWGFPKGHQEKGENGIQTAKRELEEETGLGDIRIFEDKKFQISYSFKRDFLLINKTNIFYLSQLFLKDGKFECVKIDKNEIDNYKWLEKNEVLRLLKFDNLKNIFKKAIKYK